MTISVISLRKQIYLCNLKLDHVKSLRIDAAPSSENIFVVDRLRVHTALMLSETQIAAIPSRSPKWSEAIAEYILQCVNNSFLWIWLNLLKKSLMENFIFFLVYPWLCWLLFSLQLTPCYIFLDCLKCPVSNTCGHFSPKHSAGLVDRSLQSLNISEKNLQYVSIVLESFDFTQVDTWESQ